VTGSVCWPAPALDPPPDVAGVDVAADGEVAGAEVAGADVAGAELGVPDEGADDEVDGGRLGGAEVCAAECELMRTATETRASVSTTSRLKRMNSIRGPAVRTKRLHH
jgi:hypothetical protein